ncbi:E3 ubiquitin-protein ligase TRIM56-like isoform X2 [Anneissia japonica]|uniref:E3 ubiquitin-protein ligase TRIM56-like isoform X2 n=1 Tax=Anneissia japonica TaxID=1529436 RepID=UPI00142586B4|nr:E3 ubiquitin-protein ligase TRIM56-like isoform X2 [Anneissia japonica]XP_033107905.1 E3 ubiquitin-protein ligase TRIM56-like isoform X2 [Anneissia japonica]XP_033107906.1 E3 ubiquitin-protein ligase TRIM56-like isoform X2 [Anneissia japonica]XP_033107907.1 E3 ubiquitin-protein ligase TRIM56-like isoform X2 [Anneissia japonica]
MAEIKINTFLDDIEEKVLECSICFMRLKQPKSLNCLHSFCMECLEEWANAKAELICPTCSKSYPIPEGGIQKLQPNTFINNLLESIEKMEKRESFECNCEKGITATYYCQECRLYICSTCCDHHKRFPALKSHILHSVEDVRSMTPLEFSSLHRQQCAFHNEPLKFYCRNCKTVICMHCAITDHNVGDGNHKTISISEAFNEFKENAFELTEAANNYITPIQAGLTKLFQNSTKLEENKKKCLRDIDSHVEVMAQLIRKNGKQLRKKVKKEIEKKKKENDAQIHELKTTISDVEANINVLDQVLKSNEVTAMQSSETIITALQEKIKQPPKFVGGCLLINSLDNVDKMDKKEIQFLQNQQQITELKQNGIGNVS